MREIKFRIWDKKRNEWVHDTDHAINLFGETIILGEILRRPDDSSVNMDELNNLEAMQFTGLKDKNGEEIYEGDIVNSCVCGSSEIQQVIFECGEYIAICDDRSYTSGMSLHNNFEVIGNIYENPELLK